MTCLTFLILPPGVGTTPERAEYEASSVDLSAEEGGGPGAGGSVLNVIDEDEWTDLNFGNNSTNCANTSDDSVSDLDSDQGQGFSLHTVCRYLTYQPYFSKGSASSTDMSVS